MNSNSNCCFIGICICIFKQNTNTNTNILLSSMHPYLYGSGERGAKCEVAAGRSRSTMYNCNYDYIILILPKTTYNFFAVVVSIRTQVHPPSNTSGNSCSSFPCRQKPMSTTMALEYPIASPTTFLATLLLPTSMSTSK